MRLTVICDLIDTTEPDAQWATYEPGPVRYYLWFVRIPRVLGYRLARAYGRHHGAPR